jgi:uncharacterized protein HemX
MAVSRRMSPTDLARVPLVLSAGSSRGGKLLWCALVVIAFAAGAGGGYFYWMEQLGVLQQNTQATKDIQPLRQSLEQSQLQQRVSDARSKELERQIDTLNQKLRDLEEEATFLRKARDGKH